MLFALLLFPALRDEFKGIFKGLRVEENADPRGINQHSLGHRNPSYDCVLDQLPLEETTDCAAEPGSFIDDAVQVGHFLKVFNCDIFIRSYH